MKVPVELEVSVIDLDQDSAGPSCHYCEHPLDLHQPVESVPGQLLASCDACYRWFSLSELEENQSAFLMVELPNKALIEDLLSRGTPKRPGINPG
jgi:hypothetical protein